MFPTPVFSPAQRRKALIWLAFWHIVVIAASNYLVQFPFAVLGVNTTWGAFTFPFIFLTTDLTVRVFGASLARRIIFCVMLPALPVSYVVSVLFAEGAWTGWAALGGGFNGFVARIAFASFAAYVAGQLLDITVFARLRRHARWWVAPTAAAIAGNALDTVVFFTLAFHRSSDAFMAANWPEIALVDYGVKIAVSALFFLPLYGVLLKYLVRRLTTLDGAPSDSALERTTAGSGNGV